MRRAAEGPPFCFTGGCDNRTYPHVPGIDFAGTVEASTTALQAWRQGCSDGLAVGETHWGGYATKARVKADWLVPLPEGLTTRQAMAIGTAGLTAMLAVMALEDHGLRPGRGRGSGDRRLRRGRLGRGGDPGVAGPRGGGRHGAARARSLICATWARRASCRVADLAETVKRPLESETWAGCVDAVGGAMLARVLGQMKYGASVAAVGLAGGADLPATVVPFLLRGVEPAGDRLGPPAL
jgi:acrylyl-CoA reductase (NADPH)